MFSITLYYFSRHVAEHRQKEHGQHRSDCCADEPREQAHDHAITGDKRHPGWKTVFVEHDGKKPSKQDPGTTEAIDQADKGN
jgi:hypothetical protein